MAAERGELPSLRVWRSNHCVFLCAAGRFAEARGLALQIIEDLREAGLGAVLTFAIWTLAEVTEARGRSAESAAITAYVRGRLASEGFARDEIHELQAHSFEARLRSRLDETALARAAELAATWNENTAIDFALAASAPAFDSAIATS